MTFCLGPYLAIIDCFYMFKAERGNLCFLCLGFLRFLFRFCNLSFVLSNYTEILYVFDGFVCVCSICVCVCLCACVCVCVFKINHKNALTQVYDCTKFY